MHWNYRQYCLNKYKSRNNILEYTTYHITSYTILYAFSVLLPERFGISTGEIPLHLRLPIEWDSPEMCPYTVSCSSERLIVLLLRQRDKVPHFSVYIIHHILLFWLLSGTRSEFPLRKPAVHCGIYSQALPDPIHTLRVLILWNHF